MTRVFVCFFFFFTPVVLFATFCVLFTGLFLSQCGCVCVCSFSLSVYVCVCPFSLSVCVYLCLLFCVLFTGLFLSQCVYVCVCSFSLSVCVCPCLSVPLCDRDEADTKSSTLVRNQQLPVPFLQFFCKCSMSFVRVLFCRTRSVSMHSICDCRL